MHDGFTLASVHVDVFIDSPRLFYVWSLQRASIHKFWAATFCGLWLPKVYFEWLVHRNCKFPNELMMTMPPRLALAISHPQRWMLACIDIHMYKEEGILTERPQSSPSLHICV